VRNLEMFKNNLNLGSFNWGGVLEYVTSMIVIVIVYTKDRKGQEIW
jgi:hypothetical protein